MWLRHDNNNNYMKLQLLSVCFLLVLIEWSECKAKPLSCMSFMEQLEDDEPNLAISSENLIFEDLQANNNIQVVPTQAVSVQRKCERDYTFCFALWRRTENGTRIEKQGCWKESNERNATCSQSNCTSSAPTTPKTSLYYCCCSGDLCNQRVAIVDPAPLEIVDTAAVATPTAESYMQAEILYSILIGFIVICSLAFIFVLFVCHVWWPVKQQEEAAPLESAGPGYSSNLRNVDNIRLICMLDKGKYGVVMKGLLNDEEVAVKIFAEHNQDYYMNERNIYNLCLMENPSILTYYGYDERLTLEGKREYQLVLSLASHGCLQDYLMHNLLDWQVFCCMITSITKGLSHLHTDLRHGELHKPCIVHRDFNTRNILVKQDLSCCIADFGFAIKVRGSRYEYKGESYLAPAKSINEVGTLRYMAPELLDGAVNLRDCETSLKSVDVYALGLVLWEVATRCKELYKPGFEIPAYTAPFQQEVGLHPTFDQMQNLVVRHKARPLFPVGWLNTPACKFLRDTCEDCWDHDAEARLTSMCTEVRMHEVAAMRPSQAAAAPLLNANNLNTIGVDEKDKDYVCLAEIKRLLDTEANENSTSTNSRQTFLLAPNRQLYPNVVIVDGQLQAQRRNLENVVLEKNQVQNQQQQQQQQLQPYQGRNPCQERNLAPIVEKQSPIFVERSKKHSFQNGILREQSLSCLEHDVAVEELLAGAAAVPAAKKSHFNDWTSMGEGFPKQQNFDRNLLGWHGVRALIQKKLFRTQHVHMMMNAMDEQLEEKSNLVEPRQLATILAGGNKPTNVVNPMPADKIMEEGNTLENLRLRISPQHKRPSQLDLSPIEATKRPPLRSASSYTGTPAHVQIVPRSHSNDYIELQPSNGKLSTVKPFDNHNNNDDDDDDNEDEVRMRRQRSLDVFREVFAGSDTNSLEKLRNVSQRVKTPGDVPFAVRKKRANKALSLYDDRMMDTSAFDKI